MFRHRTGPLTLRRVADDRDEKPYDHISLTPVGPTLGAFVGGIGPTRFDLASMTDEQHAELDRALLEHKVLFFRGQHITREQHAMFAARFGPLVDDQLVLKQSPNPIDNMVEFTRDAAVLGYENEWHTDGTFRPVPPLATILRALDVPAVGGDTLFADMAAAFDNLDDDLRARVTSLTAIHDWSIGAYADKFGDRLEELRAHVPPVEHPVVILHPRTARPTLFVNRLFTREIVGIDPDESDALLDLLCRQAELPELQARLHWEPGTVAFWDNVAVQHYGANDYHPQVRTMARAAVAGDPAAWPARSA
jgi:taurine dioxygenase